MTGSENGNSGTRPISVAELLAKNGTIGAPPAGGRRRRRRGNSDAVTVAELTGEIPIIVPEREPAPVVPEVPAAPPRGAAVDEAQATAAANGAAEQVIDGPAEVEVQTDAAVETDAETALETDAAVETEADRGPDSAAESDTAAAPDAAVESDTAIQSDVAAESVTAGEPDADDVDYADAVAEYAAHLEAREVEPEPLDVALAPRRVLRRKSAPAGGAAEEMSPDPVIDEDDSLDGAIDLEEPEVDYGGETDKDSDDSLPSYLRSTQGTLFGGQTVADDLARRRGDLGPEDIDLEDEKDLEDLDDQVDDQADEADAAPASTMSTLVHGFWVVGQCVIAVAFGAGLFVAFDQLWKWNNIVALVLSVLVILGLVVGVRVVRKTEDIGSTLIAVAVGALVTLGPLALLQSG